MTVGQRLTLARQALDLEPEGVAKAAEIEVADLKKYEAEKEEPDPEVLWNLAQALQMDLGFFLRTLPVTGLEAVSPRLDSLEERQQQMITAQARIWLERALDIESFFPPEEIPLPEHPANFPAVVNSGAEAAQAAERLRRAWGLGSYPIQSLNDLLENQGFRVGFVEGTEGFDACAFQMDDEFGFPLIAVGLNATGDAQRFALARELAYFMLDGATPQIAGHFAGSFLLPSDAVRRDLGPKRSDLELSELHMVKHKFGVTMRAVLARATTLRILDKETYEKWLEKFRSEGWTKQEPGVELPQETPERLIRLTLRLQAEGEITESRAAEMLGLEEEDWAAIVTLGAEIETPEEAVA